METEEGVVVRGRTSIDSRAPFRSVKEAVRLFGEKVLVGEIYANKLKEIQTKAREVHVPSKLGAVTAELEETKRSLEEAREHAKSMADCLKSLREELQQTRRELLQLKAKKEEHQWTINPEIEELKFVENSVFDKQRDRDDYHGVVFQKRKFVRFASPPSLPKGTSGQGQGHGQGVIERAASFRKEGKKQSSAMISVIGWLFSRKKKGSPDGESPRSSQFLSPKY
ncbi:hypothetical protein Ancab_026588 [Ancistrocladus abbreviatus]